jgi:pSer/pThr/pTyr-binding forkhead associated (FHA) protein
MRLLVKQSGRTVDEFQFAKGPIYIGRHPNSQVFLPGEAVSRQHAVIFNTQDGKWIVEDLDSANKTYLNDEAIHKAEIKTGDRLDITDYTVEINLEVDKEDKDTEAEKPIYLEDTLTAQARGPQIIIRRPDAEQAPPIRFPAQRAVDFLHASQAIGKANSLDEVIQVLLNIIAKQFSANSVWGALRSQPSGPMTCHAGKQRDGQAVEMGDIKFNEKITEAVEKEEFLLFLFSRDLSREKKGQIRSVVIAPIVSQVGCFGVLYANNTFRDEHYSLSDLDYLMLLAMHTATVLQKL